MVTQRRIHSVYHRNVDTSRPDQMTHFELSPWAPLDPFSPISDELWQELINTSFEYLADDSLVYNETFEVEPAHQWTNNLATEQVSSTDNVDENDLTDVDSLFRSLPGCGFCSNRHTKCDKEFPSCKACTKVNRECVYYDAVLRMDVPRR